jgi:SAM-dependent methyltransferase
MSSIDTFQLSVDQAERYEATFVPALFAEWAQHLVETAAPAPGESVLDVACGTGVVAREAARRVGERGKVVGVDLNDGMVAVAARLRPDLGWQVADAADLPFPDDSFDVVLCQAALMFFPDRVAVLRELARVAGREGRVGVHVPGRLERSPGYAPFVEIAARHAGAEAAALLGTYFVLGDPEELGALLAAAGLEVVATSTRLTAARYESVDAFVATEIGGTPLADRIDSGAYEQILEETRLVAAPYTSAAGRLEAPIETHAIVARPR